MDPRNEAKEDQQHLSIEYDPTSGNVLYTASAPPITALAFQGGGGKGRAYLGAIEQLEERGVLANVERVSGTSIGAITALLLALGCNAAKCKNLSEEFSEYSKAIFSADLNSLPDMFAEGGIYSGEHFLIFIQALINKRVNEVLQKYIDENNLPQTVAQLRTTWNIHDNPTFGDLKKIKESYPNSGIKDLFIKGTNISTDPPTSDLFSTDNTPDMEIAMAIRITVSIPKIFAPVEYQGKKYIDGGIIDNLPMEVFDQKKYRLDPDRYPYANAEVKPEDPTEFYEDINLSTLGFAVASEDEIETYSRPEDEGIFATIGEFFKEAFYNAITGQKYWENYKQELKDTRTYYAQRLVSIDDCGVPIQKFDLTRKEKRKLDNSGKRSTEDFLTSHNQEGILICSARNIDAFIARLTERDLRILKQRLEAGTIDLLPLDKKKVLHAQNKMNFASSCWMGLGGER